MSRPYISEELRRRVATRADYLCEYCLIHKDDTFLGCEIDHIISLKHGGTNDEDNLAHACAFCNRQKGSDIGIQLLRLWCVWQGEIDRTCIIDTAYMASYARKILVIFDRYP